MHQKQERKCTGKKEAGVGTRADRSETSIEHVSSMITNFLDSILFSFSNISQATVGCAREIICTKYLNFMFADRL